VRELIRQTHEWFSTKRHHVLVLTSKEVAGEAVSVSICAYLKMNSEFYGVCNLINPYG
jgi:hypothetical protein